MAPVTAFDFLDKHFDGLGWALAGVLLTTYLTFRKRSLWGDD